MRRRRRREPSASNDRREETTNYELSSQTVKTVSDGFSVQNLSIAVLVNRARLAADPDGDTQEAIDPKLAEIEQLVATAAGFQHRPRRPDQGGGGRFRARLEELEPVPPVGMMELVVRQLGRHVRQRRDHPVRRAAPAHLVRPAAGDAGAADQAGGSSAEASSPGRRRSRHRSKPSGGGRAGFAAIAGAEPDRGSDEPDEALAAGSGSSRWSATVTSNRRRS